MSFFRSENHPILIYFFTETHRTFLNPPLDFAEEETIFATGPLIPGLRLILTADDLENAGIYLKTSEVSERESEIRRREAVLHFSQEGIHLQSLKAELPKWYLENIGSMGMRLVMLSL